MNVDGRILIDGSHLNVQPKSSSSSGTWVSDQSFSTEFGPDSHGINVYGRQGGNSHLIFYNGRSGSVCNAIVEGKLNVQYNGSFNTQAILENTGGTYCSFYMIASGVTGQIYVGGNLMEIRPNPNHKMQFKTGGPSQSTTLTIDTNRSLTVHTTFYNNSDDRLKENEELIEMLVKHYLN